jgi:hypothetical protein
MRLSLASEKTKNVSKSKIHARDKGDVMQRLCLQQWYSYAISTARASEPLRQRRGISFFLYEAQK